MATKEEQLSRHRAPELTEGAMQLLAKSTLQSTGKCVGNQELARFPALFSRTTITYDIAPKQLPPWPNG